MTTTPDLHSTECGSVAEKQTDAGQETRCATTAVGVACLFAAIRIVLLVRHYAVNVLFKDQWRFDEGTLFQAHSYWQAFRWQHGPHRQGLGAVLQLWLEPLIRWNSRYEAFGIAAILICSALAALLLKRRLFGRLDYWDASIPFLLLTPVQFQVLLDSANPSHGPLPVLLVLLCCICWTFSRPLTKYLAISGLNVLLIYTGFGVLFGLITPVVFAVEYVNSRNRWALAGLFLAVMCFGSFFIGYRFDSAVTCFTPAPANPLYYGVFAGFMLSTFVGIQPVFHPVPASILGIFLLFVFVLACGICCRRSARLRSTAHVVAAILLLYSLVFCLATAYGRLCLGLSAAQGSRYMSYLTLGFFGLYLAARAAEDRFGRILSTVLTVGLVLLSSAGLKATDKRNMSILRSGRQRWASCYLSTHNIRRCDREAGFPIYWDPEPPELQTKLDLLERNHLNLFSGVQSLSSAQATTTSSK